MWLPTSYSMTSPKYVMLSRVVTVRSKPVPGKVAGLVNGGAGVGTAEEGGACGGEDGTVGGADGVPAAGALGLGGETCSMSSHTMRLVSPEDNFSAMCEPST